MSTTVGGIRIIDMPDIGLVTDDSSVVGEHAGSGRFAATAMRDYVTASLLFTPAGTGGVPRTYDTKLHEMYVSAEDYGAVGDGAADDTLSLQNAYNAAKAQGLPLLLRQTYKITAPLAVSGGAVLGLGKATTLSCATNNQIGISLTTQDAMRLENFSITSAAGTTGVTAIQISPTGVANAYTILRDLFLAYVSKCIVTDTAHYLTIDNVNCLMFDTLGIQIRNVVQPDSGDSSVVNCMFLCANTSGTGLQQNSSGGLKIANCKFLSGLYGYALFLDGGANTGDLLIANCSFEGQAGTSIQLGQEATGGNFHSVEITGCQFNQTFQAVGVVNAFSTPGWLTDLSISGGSMWIKNAGYGINLDGVTGFSVGGVDFYSLGASMTCVNITAHCASGILQPMNRFGAGVTTYVANAGANVTVMPKLQRGSGTVTAATAVGALWAGDGATIYFPYPFLGAPPVVIMTPNAIGAGAAVSAYPSSKLLDSFNPHVVGFANGAVSFDWVAMGDW